MLSGCSNPEPRNPKLPDLPAYGDPEQLIEIDVGKEFALKCTQGGITARHEWRIGEEPDHRVAVFVRFEDRSPHDCGSIVDSPRVENWVFRATGPGETKISLRADWVPGQEEPPAKTKTFRVVVR
jgi:hypothetical protein